MTLSARSSVLAEKIPDNVLRHNPRILQQIFRKEAGSLSVNWETSVKNGWLAVSARGEDSEVFMNSLRRKYDVAPVDFGRLEKWDVHKGFLTEIGKVGFGIYVDLGILEPTRKDALYPLHRMRAQLADGEQKSAKEISSANAFSDYFPVKMVATEIDRDKITVELDEQTRQDLVSWRELPWDRIVMFGSTHEQAVKTVREVGLWNDMIDVESLSLFVQSLVLKVGTEAPGIISRIGRRLRGVGLTAYTQHRKL